MLPAYISHADCQKHEMGSLHPECPQRIDAIHDHLLIKGLLDCMQPYDAPAATEEQLGRAHTLRHVRDMHARAQQAEIEQYVSVDPDTWMNQFSYHAAVRAAGAAVLATDLVIGGKAQAAFCNVRPPGHHAGRDFASGFCFFNNVAVGIRHALDVHGLERVALIDFDVHHGNGSEDILANDARVLMCSTFERDLYPFSGTEPLGDNMVNMPLPPRSGGEPFREAVERHWLPALEAFRPQMIFFSAGFDGHRDDDMSTVALTEADYEWATRKIMEIAERHAGGRVVSCLEGGYELHALARSVAAHVKVLIGAAG